MNSKNHLSAKQTNSRPGYEYLSVYKLGKVIQDLTFQFCRCYVSRFSRTYDQMIQAARSNPQNVAEGYSGVSLKNYIKLAGIAQGSNEELAKDYEDFLRQRSLPTWDKNHPKIRKFRQFRAAWTGPNQLNTPNLPNNPAEAANMLLTFCLMEGYLLAKLVASLKEKHRREGGFTENLYKRRVDYRRQKKLGGLGIFFWLLGGLGILGLLGLAGMIGAPAAQAANSGSFSISIQVKPTASPANKAIIGKAEELRIVTNANSQPLCQIMSGSNWQTAVVSSAAIGVGAWSQIICTYDHNYLKIYVNGEEKGSQALSADVDDTSADLKIGVDESSGSSYGAFAGVVDDFYFYNYALSEDEVKTLYNQGFGAVMGAGSTATTTAGAHIPSNAASREYCVPGSDDYCAPPVLELKFDEKQGTTAYDTSGNGNDGTLVNGPTWTRGKFGSALSFDGSDDYVSASSSLLDNLGPMTVEAWINPKSWGESSVGTIVNKDAENWFFRLDGWNNTLEFNKKCNTTNLQVRASTNSFNSSDFNKWSYVVLTWNGSTSTAGVEFYINGAKKGKWGTNGEGNLISDAGHVLRIGSLDYATDDFDGLIDNVKIYNYVRTPAQIAWDFNRGKPVAEWRFDECKGSTIYDSAKSWNGGTANNGTLHLGAGGVTAIGTCASSSDSFWYNGRSGHLNSAGSFDGTDDYVAVGDINVSSSTSFSFWLKPNSLNTFILDLDGGTHYIRLSNGAVQAVGFSSPTIYVDGEQKAAVDTNWHHIVVVNNYGLDANNVNIGMHYDMAGSFFFNGLIDEVKIFNYGLTAAQIKQEYAGGAVRFGE